MNKSDTSHTYEISLPIHLADELNKLLAQGESLEQRIQSVLSDYTMRKKAPMIYFNMVLSIRTSNVLYKNGIKTLADLLGYSWRDLLRMHGFGKKSKAELEQFLLNNNVILDSGSLLSE